MKTYISALYIAYLISTAGLMSWAIGFGLPHPAMAARAPSAGMDPKALPRVLHELSLQDSILRKGYIAICDMLPEPVSRHLPQVLPAAEVRANAAGLVGLFGPDAKPAVPQLIKLLRDDLADANAANSLALLGPAAEDAVPALVQALREGRPFAATALAAIGRPALVAQPALEAAALSGPAWLRQEAAHALRKLENVS